MWETEKCRNKRFTYSGRGNVLNIDWREKFYLLYLFNALVKVEIARMQNELRVGAIRSRQVLKNWNLLEGKRGDTRNEKKAG